MFLPHLKCHFVFPLVFNVLFLVSPSKFRACGEEVHTLYCTEKNRKKRTNDELKTPPIKINLLNEKKALQTNNIKKPKTKPKFQEVDETQNTERLRKKNPWLHGIR